MEVTDRIQSSEQLLLLCILKQKLFNSCGTMSNYFSQNDYWVSKMGFELELCYTVIINMMHKFMWVLTTRPLLEAVIGNIKGSGLGITYPGNFHPRSKRLTKEIENLHQLGGCFLWWVPVNESVFTFGSTIFFIQSQLKVCNLKVH